MENLNLMDNELILSMYKKSHSIPKTAKALNVSSTTIYRHLKALNANTEQQKGFKDISMEQQLQIIQQYNDGIKVTKIVKDYSISDTTVYKILHENEVTLNKGLERKQKYSDEIRVYVTELYKKGESIEAIARDLEMGTSTVRKILHQYGIQIKPRGKTSNPVTNTEKTNIISDYNNGSGKSLRSMSKEYHHSTSSIRKVLLEANVLVKPIRSGARSGNFKTGRIILKNGYVQILITDENRQYIHNSQAKGGSHYIPEHRLVVAKKLGRLLEKYQTVHHLDGNRSNNEPSNLVLKDTNHGAGADIKSPNEPIIIRSNIAYIINFLPIEYTLQAPINDIKLFILTSASFLTENTSIIDKFGVTFIAKLMEGRTCFKRLDEFSFVPIVKPEEIKNLFTT